MKTLIQRVRRASVSVEGSVVGEIEHGVLLFVGVQKGDAAIDADATARKIQALRIFPGRTPMDRTLADVGGACLVVSQFTLAGSLKKGNRPGFDKAEDPARAEALYLRVAEQLAASGLRVERGSFGAMMDVDLVNDGPVTFLLEVQEGRVQ